jgi:hypothetical protein
MRILHVFIAVAIGAVMAAPSAAQSNPSPTPQTPPADNKAEEKPGPAIESSPVGKWRMTVDSDSPDRTSLCDLKLDGKKLSGTCTATSGDYPVTGEFDGAKLTFSIDYQTFKLAFTGGFKDDGTLAGTMDYGAGPLTWKAERVKEK